MSHAQNHGNQFVALGWIAATVLAYLAFLIVQPFLAPIGWAAVIAIVFYPVQARLERRWGASRAAAVTTLIVALMVIAPLLAIATAFVNEALAAVRDLQDAVASNRFAWIERVSRRVLQVVPMTNRPDVAAAVLDAAQSGALKIAAYSGSILRNIVTFVLDLVLALFASYFLFRDAPSIVSTIRSIIPLGEAARERMMMQTADLIAVSVRSSVIVAGLQGFLGGCLFAAVGIDAPVFWGVVMAWFCLLPLGAWLVWLPAAILFAAAGSIGRALVVAALGFAIVSAVDNFLRPMLLSGRAKMNGLLVFVSLLGGMAAFGALGLVLGPVVMATGAAILTAYADSRRRDAPVEAD